MKDIFKRKMQNDMILGREPLLARGVAVGRGVLTEQDANRIDKTMSSMTPKGVVTKQDAKRLEKAFPLRQPVQYK